MSVVWACLWVYCECSVGVALVCGEYSVSLGVFVNVVWAWFSVYAECSVGVALVVL